MAYKPSTSACPITCLNMDAVVDCPFPNVEGCECYKGMVLSGTNCVPKDKCGCVKNKIYFAVSKHLAVVYNTP